LNTVVNITVIDATGASATTTVNIQDNGDCPA
jgi:archaellum component FlaF (FlaF/FlaG flagellin family)